MLLVPTSSYYILISFHSMSCPASFSTSTILHAMFVRSKKVVIHTENILGQLVEAEFPIDALNSISSFNISYPRGKKVAHVTLKHECWGDELEFFEKWFYTGFDYRGISMHDIHGLYSFSFQFGIDILMYQIEDNIGDFVDASLETVAGYENMLEFISSPSSSFIQLRNKITTYLKTLLERKSGLKFEKIEVKYTTDDESSEYM